MAFNPFKRHVPPSMSLQERVAREKGIYPEEGTGWDIPFQIFYSGKTQVGYLIANHVHHITGLPGTFLVYWDTRFRGVINYTSEGWEMERTDPAIVEALGNWIVLYYQ